MVEQERDNEIQKRYAIGATKKIEKPAAIERKKSLSFKKNDADTGNLLSHYGRRYKASNNEYYVSIHFFLKNNCFL